MGLALVFGLVSAQAGRGTLAYFTDSATSTGNVFTTGTLDLKIAETAPNDETTAANTVASTLTLSTMKPGDTITRSLNLSNPNGTGTAVTAQYALTSAVTAGDAEVASRMDLFVGSRTTSGTCDSTAAFNITSTTTALTDWPLIYQGDLARSTALNLVGDPTHGPGTTTAASGQISGDRSIAGAGSEFLCFRVDFKNSTDRANALSTAGNANADSFTQSDNGAGSANAIGGSDDNYFQNKTATVSFTFAAVQASTGTAN